MDDHEVVIMACTKNVKLSGALYSKHIIGTENTPPPPTPKNHVFRSGFQTLKGLNWEDQVLDFGVALQCCLGQSMTRLHSRRILSTNWSGIFTCGALLYAYAPSESCGWKLILIQNLVAPGQKAKVYLASFLKIAGYW